MKIGFKISITLLTFLILTNVYGTIQTPETFIVGNDTILIQEYPLSEKLKHDTTLLKRWENVNPDGTFTMCISSTCWRGYKGTWTIINDSLFLMNLIPPCELEENEDNPLAIDKLFKGNIADHGVFADWVNDTLNTICIMLPCDKGDIHFVISNGIVIKNFETINKDWLERHPEYTEQIESDLEFEKETIESENSNQYIWYFLIGGIAFGLLIMNKRRLTKNKCH